MKPFTTLSTTLLNLIRWLSSKLGKVPSLIYFLGYFMVIFVFSLVYYVLPGKHFYYSTSLYEYEFFNNDTNEILSDLQAEIIHVYQKTGGPSLEVNGWRTVTDKLEVDSLTTEKFPLEFSFHIVIPINNGTEGNWDSWTFLAAKLTVFTEGKIIFHDIVYSPFKIEGSYVSPVQGIPSMIPTPGIVFHYTVLDQQGDELALPLSLNLYNRIIERGRGYSEFLSKSNSGQYLRMLYFSTAIATFSALGGIVPVSTTARLFVTSEIVSAVVFIALFLNSLAYDVGEVLKNAQSIDEKTNRIVYDKNGKRQTRPVTPQKVSKSSKQKPRQSSRR